MKESEWSPQKKKEFKRVLQKIANVVGVLKVGRHYDLWQNKPDRFIYIDLYAGDGGFPGGWGSPCIAIDVLSEVRETFGLDYEMHLYENNQKGEPNAERLEIILGKALSHPPEGCSVFLHKEDNIAVTDLFLPEKSWGLVYADPYGGCEYIKTLRALSVDPRYEKIDFLINLNPASIKRVNAVHEKCKMCSEGSALDTCLGAINKKYIKVREPDIGQPYSMWQWAMTFLTNNQSLFSESWRKYKWHTMTDSVERIAELAKTNKELAVAK